MSISMNHYQSHCIRGSIKVLSTWVTNLNLVCVWLHSKRLLDDKMFVTASRWSCRAEWRDTWWSSNSQQAALELVKRVLMTRIENDARKKVSPFYEKEISGGNLAWSMSNNFLIATVCGILYFHALLYN